MNRQNNLFEKPPQVLSVADYITLINSNLEVLSDIAVEGEVSEFKISRQKWVTFRLKDEKAEASLECFTVIFKLNVPLENGMKIRIQGRPRIYPRYGRFSVNVEYIELAGEGSLKRAFELTKVKLRTEGLFDKSRKRTLPPYPQRIGLITSPEAAAYTDFLKVLKHRFGGIKIYFVPVRVQGKGAIENITAAFDWFNENYQKYHIELIVLTRGGGSLEDLQAFNSEEVARAIFSSKIPVVCGIGHERDESLADFVADLRASTPSNAAELIVRDRREIETEINNFVFSMETNIQNFIEQTQKSLGHFFANSSHLINEKTYDIRQTLSIFFHQIQSFLNRLRQKEKEVSYLTQSIRSAFIIQLHSLSHEIKQQVTLLQSFHPKNVLKRGYGILRQKNGKIIKDASRLLTGEDVKATVYRGSFISRVKTIKPS